MDLEERIQKEFDKLKGTQALHYKKEENKASVLKDWENVSLGIIAEENGDKRNYIMKYNQILLGVEITQHKGYKEYSRYYYKLGDKPWQDIKLPTFNNRLRHFMEVSEFYQRLSEAENLKVND